MSDGRGVRHERNWKRIPSSTYRLQLRTPASDPDGVGFTFTDAKKLVPYLADLGIGALYLSPILSAAPGSTHGYDVINPTEVEPALGGAAGLRSLRATCIEYGLGLVVDIVPNHLGVDPPEHNRWWWEALRLGPGSPTFDYFDFDTSPDNGAAGKIALPVLGAPGDLGQLSIDRTGQDPVLCYYQHRFPIAPGTDDGSGREVHARQHYRLVHWREPLLGYRRFFTVTALAGLRQELPQVFAASHAAVQQWCEEDLIDGIRVDHPDGLADPIGYLNDLRQLIGPDRWLVAEKILAPTEVLDSALSADGTTGYDLLRLVDQVLVDSAGQSVLSRLATRYCGHSGDSGYVHQQSAKLKREVLAEDLAPEVARLTRAVCRDANPTSDGSQPVPDSELVEALGAIIAATKYYRADYPVLRGALPRIVNAICSTQPELESALTFIAVALAAGGETSRRLAQVTGAATAKAEEDRLFYRLGRLISLNEVGGSPDKLGLPVGAFHLALGERAQSIPWTMTTLSTHDTKRGEDVRARISVLSQVPQQWSDLVSAIFTVSPPPSEDTGYFLLQAVIGVWPITEPPDARLRSRLCEYATKALREAAQHTSWTEPHTEFESAVHTWIDCLLEEHAGTINAFVSDIDPAGRDNALAAKALQLLSPGIPDIYQGTEVWDDSLVDPDNRRLVDFPSLISAAESHPKQELVRTLARLRRDRHEPEWACSYRALLICGPAAEDAIGFLRGEPGPKQVGLLVRRRTAVVGLDALAGSSVILPQGQWLARSFGETAPSAQREKSETVWNGHVDLAELFAAGPVVILTPTE